MTLDTLRDLYLEQLRDLYSAETQLIEAMPMMAERASHQELKMAMQQHLEQTKQQRQRLEQIFDSLGESPRGETCKAMEGLIREGMDMMKKRNADPDVLDAGLIAAAQRVEHYEISGYGTVATYAELLGRQEDHRLLGQTLQEEKDTDQMLNRIAIQVVNPEAAQA